jgi:hypothetical protein
MASGRILALDQATWTGWCWGAPGEAPKHGVYRMPSVAIAKEKQLAVKLVGFERWLREMLEQNDIERVVYEQPFLPQGDKGPPRSFASEFGRWGIPVVIEMAAYRSGVVFESMPVVTWRSALGVATQAPRKNSLTGAKTTNEWRRKFLKEAVMQKCRALGFSPKTTDESDAIGLWLAVISKDSRRVEAPGFDFMTAMKV